MITTLLNVVYVLVAITMIVFILLQRGAGAQAGSGFGSGASGTVFGARGSANFLSSSTKWLAAVFFIMSLGMTYRASHEARADGTASPSIMSDLPADAGKPAAPAPTSLAPAPAAATPAAAPIIAPAPATTAPATTTPASTGPAASTPAATPPVLAPATPPSQGGTPATPAQGSKGG
jgi:preprotein translocase subunit SecG